MRTWAYVDPNYTGFQDGSKSNPYTSLPQALTAGTPAGLKHVYLQSGTYTITADLVIDVNLIGGFDATWHRTAVNPTVLATGAPAGVTSRITLVQPSGAPFLEWADLTILAPDELQVGASSNPLIINNSPSVIFENVTVASGTIRWIAPGGIQGFAGTDGNSGGLGQAGCDGCFTGGFGGTGALDLGFRRGGSGGDGGYDISNGASGSSGGGGASGGAGGKDGDCFTGSFAGQSGLSGLSGSPGLAAPAMAQHGTIDFANITYNCSLGGQGAHGIDGGGGTGGAGGGNSFAIMLFDSKLTASNCHLTTGFAASGGRGESGSPGGNGGSGGSGGIGPDDGGNGGAGGFGGNGARGAGGHSCAVAQIGVSSYTAISTVHTLGNAGVGGAGGIGGLQSGPKGINGVRASTLILP